MPSFFRRMQVARKSFYQSMGFFSFWIQKSRAKAKCPHPKKGTGGRMADKGEG
jgi:hypothetical protein